MKHVNPNKYFLHLTDDENTEITHKIKYTISNIFSQIIQQIDPVLSYRSAHGRTIEEELKSTPWETYRVFSLPGQKPFWEISHQEAEQLLIRGLDLLYTSWVQKTDQEIECYKQAMLAFRKAAPGCKEAQYILVLVQRAIKDDPIIAAELNVVETMITRDTDQMSEVVRVIDRHRKGAKIQKSDGTLFSTDELEKLQDQGSKWIDNLKAQCMEHYRLLAQFGDLESARKLLKMQKPHAAYEAYELAAELGHGTDAASLLQNKNLQPSEEALTKWLQVQMNFDPSCAAINAYRLTCLKNFHAQCIPDQKLRSLSPDEMLKIMGAVLPDAIKIKYDDAFRDLAQFTVYHEDWAREQKAQLLPYFEDCNKVPMNFTSSTLQQQAIDACNSLTPREQMRVDCKAAYQKAALEVQDGTSALPEFKPYQQLAEDLQNDRMQTENLAHEQQWKPRWDLWFLLFALLPAWMMLPEFLRHTSDWGWVQWCMDRKLPEYANFIVLLGIPALGIARGIYSKSKWNGVIFGALYMFCMAFAITGTYWMFLSLLLLYAVLLSPWRRARRKVLSPEKTNRLEQQITEAWNALMTAVSRVSREACKPYADAFEEGELEKCQENWNIPPEQAKYKSHSGELVPLMTDSVKEEHRLTKEKAARSARLSAILSVIFVAAAAVFFLGSGMLKDLLPERQESRPADSVQTEREESSFVPDQTESQMEETVQTESETDRNESGSAQDGTEAGEVDWSDVQSLYADKLSQSDALLLAQFADTPVMKQIQGLEEFMQSRDVEVLDFYGAEHDDNGLMLTYKVKESGITNWITISSSDHDSLNKLVLHVDLINMSTFWDQLCHDFYHLDTFALPQDLLETLDRSGYREEWEVSNGAWSARVYYAGNQTNVVVDIF